MEKILLKIPEAAELIGLGRSKAYELAATGEWPTVRIGRAVRIPLAGLREWVAKLQTTDGGNDGLQAG